MTNQISKNTTTHSINGAIKNPLKKFSKNKITSTENNTDNKLRKVVDFFILKKG